MPERRSPAPTAHPRARGEPGGACLGVPLVLEDEAGAADQRAQTEYGAQERRQGGYEHGCDDTRDACDQQDPEHQLRGVHAADFRVRRHEVIAVLVHDVIGIEPAAATMVAGAALVQRHLVIGERAGVQIVDRQQRLLLLALRMLLEAPRVARALDVLQVVGMLRGEGGPVEIVAGVGACVMPVMSGARSGVWMFFTRVGIVVVAIVMIGHTVLL